MKLKNPAKYFIGDWDMVPHGRQEDWIKMRLLARFDRYRRVATQAEPEASRVQGGLPARSLFSISPTIACQQLHDQGICLGLDLPEKILGEIQAFSRSEKFALNGNPAWLTTYGQYRDSERHFGMQATHGLYANPHEKCSAIAKVHGDPLIREIARLYLGASPVSHDVKLMWSFPANASARTQSRLAQRFHFDLDDYRFIKFFFYITDVGPQAGPHVYVKGSHKGKPFWDQLFMRRFSDAYIEKLYGKEAVQELCGPAGFGFVEDTYGVHKGTPPSRDARLLLQFEFATVDYGVKLL